MQPSVNRCQPCAVVPPCSQTYFEPQTGPRPLQTSSTRSGLLPPPLPHTWGTHPQHSQEDDQHPFPIHVSNKPTSHPNSPFGNHHTQSPTGYSQRYVLSTAGVSVWTNESDSIAYKYRGESPPPNLGSVRMREEAFSADDGVSIEIIRDRFCTADLRDTAIRASRQLGWLVPGSLAIRKGFSRGQI